MGTLAPSAVVWEMSRRQAPLWRIAAVLVRHADAASSILCYLSVIGKVLAVTHDVCLLFACTDVLTGMPCASCKLN